ncbi:MAG: thioesterase family protein [Acidimicrobiia bacterium]
MSHRFNEEQAGDPEAFRAIHSAMEQVPFGKWLGLELTGIEDDRVQMRFEMRDEMVGNPARSALHGGVISSVLDTVGGFAALIGYLTRASGQEADISPWLSTIDLRTDYLRPGVGARFTASAFPLRVGNRLVVTRMELHGESGDLIAVGTGTYVLP